MWAKPGQCVGCPLWGTGHGFSAVTGTGQIPLLAVAEASGEHEEREGRPLVEYAPSGSIFERALRDIGIDRTQIGVTNVLRCKPPSNKLSGMPYEREAIDRCKGYLTEVVQKHRPRVLLALGDTPLRELTGVTGVMRYRGFVLPSVYGGAVCVGTYHPAFLLRGAMHLYGVFVRDVKFAVQIAKEGVPPKPPTNYVLNPTDDDLRGFLDAIRCDAALPVAYDVETAGILRGAEPATSTRIIQVQFSIAPGTAIVCRPTEHRPFIAEVLTSPNPKWGWNSRGFDDPVLEAAGFTIGGQRHDLMLAWQHLQPSFSSDRSDTDDKGVPSRLMGLQSAASFFTPETGPWKHLSADVANLALYGAVDADITGRCGRGIFTALEAQGLLTGYLTHKVALRPVLDGLGRRGLPVDAGLQAELRAYTVSELDQLSTTMQLMVPDEVKPVKRYKTKPDVVQPFNPGSSKQLLAYIKHRGYRVPTMVDNPAKETTGKLELERLAAETGDAVLAFVVQHRSLRKTGMDYTSGKWVPGVDGRVHATFRWGTASGQLTAVDPPVQTFPEHSGIAKRAKAAIRAQTGHTLYKRDMTGFHSRMAGWLANDPDWYRLASLDVHSYVTAHFLHLQGADYLLELPDVDLAAELAIIKRMHSHTRNYKVKRCVHGVTFGLKARKLHRMYPDAFGSPTEAQQLIAILQRLFPKTFVAFPRWVENQIRSVTRCRLVSPFGHHRMFYDFDMEQAIAYLPSNAAHCHIQAALVRLHESGALDRYEAVNFSHDALWLHPPVDKLAECDAEIKAELERPSDVLVSSPLGPFWCPSAAEAGPALSEMEAYGNWADTPKAASTRPTALSAKEDSGE